MMEMTSVRNGQFFGRRSQADTGSIIQPQPGAFGLFCRHFQPFFAPDPLYSLMVHSPSIVPEHCRDPAVSIATIAACQLDDLFGEHHLVFGGLAIVALR